MKKLMPIAVMAVLAACTPGESEDVTDIETVEGPETEVMAVDGQPLTGTYEATGPDGNIVTQELDAYGNVTNTAADAVSTTGTYTAESGDRVCFQYADQDPAESCYLQSEPGEDGSWTATSETDETDVWTVRRAPPSE